MNTTSLMFGFGWILMMCMCSRLFCDYHEYMHTFGFHSAPSSKHSTTKRIRSKFDTLLKLQDKKIQIRASGGFFFQDKCMLTIIKTNGKLNRKMKLFMNIISLVFGLE